jgi:hypothetical protein
MSTLPEHNDSAETLLKKILEVYQNGGGIGPEGPAGPQGIQGIPGLDGKTIRNGSGAPASGLGVDGDFYIDTSNNLIYGPKTGGSWGSGTSIVGPAGPTGATGATGADGQSSSFYDYKAKTNATSGDPGNTYLLWNNTAQTSATQINVSHINADQYDIDVLLALITTGTIFIIQDSGNSNNYQKWQVSGAPVLQTGYVEYPVTLVTSSGTGSSNFGNNLNVLFIVATSGGGGTGGADLQEVWMHAGI